MVALAGTWAAVEFVLVREMTAPPGGAAPFNVSVPVEDDPPTTVLGFRVSDESDATVTVRVLLRVVP